MNIFQVEKYAERLKNFEKKHNMKSEKFIKEFEAGNIGDDAEWFDWFFAWNAWKKTVEKAR